MKFEDFRKAYSSHPLIISRDIMMRCPCKQVMRNQLDRWVRAGKLLKLRRGVYIFGPEDRKVEMPLAAVANVLLEPSYVSLEYALRVHGLIPEAVFTVTSITTRKTHAITNTLGSFSYQHIKPSCFRGFVRAGSGAASFFIATPEKALLDLLYLRLGEIRERSVGEQLAESFRLQNVEQIRCDILLDQAGFFQCKKLQRVAREAVAWIQGEGSGA